MQNEHLHTGETWGRKMCVGTGGKRCCFCCCCEFLGQRDSTAPRADDNSSGVAGDIGQLVGFKNFQSVTFS